MKFTLNILLLLLITFFISCKENSLIVADDVIDMSEYQLQDRLSVDTTLKNNILQVTLNNKDTAAVQEYRIAVDTIANENQLYLEYLLYNVDSIESYSYKTKSTEYLLNKTFGKKTKYYVFHCTASKEGVDLSPAWFVNFFLTPEPKGRGWSRVGYTELLSINGNWDQLRLNNYDGYTSYDEMTYGVAGINSEAMHFAYVGGVDKDLKPKNTLTAAQYKGIRDKILQIRCFDPEAKIIFGHRDYPGVRKACPSFDMASLFKDILPN